LGLCVIVFSLLAGWLCDRFDRRWLTFWSGTIGAGAIAIMLTFNSIAAMYVAAAVFGLAYALFNVSSWALGTDIIPQERAGEFLGLQNLAGAGSGAIGAYIGGPIADASGYVILFALFGLMFLLSSIAVVFVKGTQETLAPAAVPAS
jgi:MFS family permease